MPFQTFINVSKLKHTPILLEHLGWLHACEACQQSGLEFYIELGIIEQFGYSLIAVIIVCNKLILNIITLSSFMYFYSQISLYSC